MYIVGVQNVASAPTQGDRRGYFAGEQKIFN